MINSEIYKVVGLLKPVSLSTATTGSAVAIQLFEDDCVAVLQTGAFAGTTPTVSVTIEASTTSATGYVTVGTFTATALTTGGEAAVGVNLAGQKYVRAKIAMSSADTTTVVPISVCLFGQLDYEASNINSPIVA